MDSDALYPEDPSISSEKDTLGNGDPAGWWDVVTGTWTLITNPGTPPS